MPRVTVTVPNKQTQPYRFPLDREKVTLGRGSDNDIPMASGSVSVHHAVMVRTPDGFELRDLDSTNGISYHGERKISLPLQSGMMVKLGEVEFLFQLSEEEEIALAAETATPTEPMDSGAPTESLRPDEEREEKTERSPKKDKSRIKASETPIPPRPAHTNQSNGGMITVFILLALVAFCVGMAIRHERDTGKSLIETIQGR